MDKQTQTENIKTTTTKLHTKVTSSIDWSKLKWTLQNL